MRTERVGSLEAAREEWTALAELSGNPFATWEWAVAWWRRYGTERELLLHRVRTEDGRVAALLPLYRADRGPLPVARFVGHGAADQLGPVCAPADRSLAADGLRTVARALPPHGLLLAERLVGEEGVASRLRGRPVRAESSPVLRADGSWDDWLAARSANMRQQIRRRERRLVREHGLTFRLSTDPERLAADMAVLYALHDARWPAGESTAFTEPRRALHDEFAALALERGWLRLWLAEAGGRALAAWYGFRFAGREWYFQAGRDPAWDREAVGFVLLVHSIRSALQDGVREYRFGLGDEPYKSRFASEDPGVETVVLGRRGPVDVAALAAAAGRRMPPGVRRRLVRRAG